MPIDFAQSQTHQNLLRAFAGESQARNRYTFAAGLALSRKGAQQILMGLTLGKVDGHVRSLPFHGCP